MSTISVNVDEKTFELYKIVVCEKTLCFTSLYLFKISSKLRFSPKTLFAISVNFGYLLFISVKILAEIVGASTKYFMHLS